MKDDSESDEEGLRYELIGGGGGGGPHWTRTQGETVEKGGRLTRKVVEKSPGGTHCVTLEHDATPAGGEDPKEKARRAARNKQASRRARKSLNIEETQARRDQDADWHTLKRAAETEEQTQARRDQDAESKKLKRAAETTPAKRARCDARNADDQNRKAELGPGEQEAWKQRVADRSRENRMLRQTVDLLRGRDHPAERRGLFAACVENAHRGSGPDMLRVGRMYEEGDGVERDMLQAIMWYKFATMAGSSEALSIMAKLCVGGETHVEGDENLDNSGNASYYGFGDPTHFHSVYFSVVRPD
eukprot:CAMPEP_0119484074 /NCGR_PEP_ID=MMETSP1344-20130328/11191_1 /TAXON_ID=236787 /ORGANISM="Florenciella parvula, Strain CCMP2471" /LENGTH=301 /DNA_ID=CAMNT_0007518611 /DNA_START=415 /DNA_END=1317 /DNA_ORIENTATION=-